MQRAAGHLVGFVIGPNDFLDLNNPIDVAQNSAFPGHDFESPQWWAVSILAVFELQAEVHQARKQARTGGWACIQPDRSGAHLAAFKSLLQYSNRFNVMRRRPCSRPFLICAEAHVLHLTCIIARSNHMKPAVSDNDLRQNDQSEIEKGTRNRRKSCVG